jgi:multidrug efflux pump subunit AcrA (membrane-fusion protein)
MRALLFFVFRAVITLLAGCGAEQMASTNCTNVKVRIAHLQAPRVSIGRSVVRSSRAMMRHSIISGQVGERLAQAGQRVEAGDVLPTSRTQGYSRQQLAVQITAARGQAGECKQSGPT